MEETVALSSDASPSLAELIASLEKHVMLRMDTLVDQLQSLQQEGKLDQTTLKSEFNQASRLAQASLLIRALTSLLAPPTAKGGDIETGDLFKKIHQTAENLHALYKDQTMKEIDLKAAQILEQIQNKEQQIRSQIAQKQQAIAQLVRSQTHAR